MSADNYIVIRKDFETNKFVPVMGFASDDYEAVINEKQPRFDTVEKALASVQDEYVEYGISVHPECNAKTFTVVDPSAVAASVLTSHYLLNDSSTSCLCGESLGDPEGNREAIALHQSAKVLEALSA